MKVAVLHGPGDLRLDDAQRPVAGPDDLVVKVARRRYLRHRTCTFATWGRDLTIRCRSAMNLPAR